MLPLDRREFIAALGGTAAVGLMSHEARADAIEDALLARTNGATLAATAAASAPVGAAPRKYPTVAELAASVADQPHRRGAGGIFVSARGGGKVPLLPKMPANPTLVDFFNLRFDHTRNHCFQSAALALKNGVDEPVVLACLLHDTVQELMKTDHGYWGAQLYEGYVPERTRFAIKYHQALRFFADDKAGYEMPDMYRSMFGIDYVPVPHLQRDYAMVRKHKWYDAPRAVTVNDLYSFDDKAKVSIDQFVDIIGRNFKQPREGLGNDNSPNAHMWRTLANPDAPL
ncbi:MAG: hypothetical protein ABIQ86_12460 [Steroidobacteraceae bacterium]